MTATATFTALVGLAGVIVGALLKVLYDIWKTRHDENRQDTVWRREHALTAAAELLEAASAVHVLGRTIGDSITDLQASREARHPDEVIQQKWQRLDLEKQQKRAQLERANAALSRLSLLVEQETYMTANRYLSAVSTSPRDPANAVLSAYLNNLLRADLGLPPRVIPDDEQLTPEEAMQRLTEMQGEQQAGSAST